MKWLGIVGALGLALATAVHANEVVIPGSFAVSESGAATYSIDIDVPPGTAGIEPKLALTYSSQGGNGLLGVGWSLSGLSNITRCPKTVAQDGVRGAVNFDADDRFCLDGQRLFATSGGYGASGTEYRTEMDGFSRITSTGTTGTGPTSFTVETKSGLTMTFGGTTDSRLLPHGNASVMSWSVNRIEDTLGNYMEMTYFISTAESMSYPSTISYTGNGVAVPFATVAFSYELRADAPFAFHAGSQFSVAGRLRQITTSVGSSVVLKYTLGYEYSPYTDRSRLTHIYRCDEVGACLPPTILSYPSAPLNRFEYENNFAGQNGVYGGFKSTVADFSGDGLADVFWDQVNIHGQTLGVRHVWTSTGNGNFHFDTNVAGVNGTGVAANSRPYNLEGDGGAEVYWLTGDTYGRYQGPAMYFWRQNGLGSWSGLSVPGSHGYLFGSRPHLGDFDGDGKTDILWDTADQYGRSTGTRQMFLGASPSSIAVGYTYVGNVAGQDGARMGNVPYLGDFNGDGRTDILWNCEGTYGQSCTPASRAIWMSTGAGAFAVTNLAAPFLGLHSYAPSLADFNGDGKTDVLWSYIDTFGRSIGYETMWLSMGNGQFTGGTIHASLAGQLTYHKPYIGDFTGDGMADILWESVDTHGRNNGARILWVSNGHGSFVDEGVPSGTLNGTLTIATAQLGDFNGNGRADLLYDVVDVYGRSSASRTLLRTVGGGDRDLLSSIDDGFGPKVQLTYKSLTDSSVYSGQITPTSSLPTYPLVNITPAIQVVSRAEVRDGIGGFVPTEYRYGGLKARADGRGSLGFAWSEAEQTETGFVTRREYRQDYPYVGRVSLERTSAPGVGLAGVLSEKTYSFGCLNPANGLGCTEAAGNRYFPYASSIVEKGWDLDGSVLPVVTTTNAYDSWGNATSINVSTSDGFTKATTNTYTNNAVNWILGRLTRTEVTDVTP